MDSGFGSIVKYLHINIMTQEGWMSFGRQKGTTYNKKYIEIQLIDEITTVQRWTSTKDHTIG